MIARRAATDEEMLQRYPRRARAPHWFIRVEEVSAYVYRVSARDRWGHEVSHTGTGNDLDHLIEDVERYAERMADSSR
jgi:hypothetical protein